MSAPDTNIHKQEKNHRPSLFGIKGAMILGVFILVGAIGFNLINGGSDTVDKNAVGTEAGSTDVYAPGTNSSTAPTATD